MYVNVDYMYIDGFYTHQWSELLREKLSSVEIHVEVHYLLHCKRVKEEQCAIP